MSHFVAWVIAPEDVVRARGAEAVAEVMLERFDEGIEVEEYLRECRCGEWGARMRARRVAGEEHADLEAEVRQTRARFQAERAEVAAAHPDDRRALATLEERHSTEWQTHVIPLIERIRASEDALYAADPSRMVPDPACSECAGSGVYPSTYNPDSKWDWWQVGGRWSGAFDPSEEGRDVLPLAEAESTLLPVAIITPGVTWHEEGAMGWFGTMRDRKVEAEWAAEVAALRSEYADHTLIVCDCHI